MSKGIFTDKSYRPTIDEIHEVIAAAGPLWERLISFISSNFKSAGALKFYGKNYGWALSFYKSGKSLTAVYPGDNGFTVQIILKAKQAEEALTADISEEIKDIIGNTPEIHEGRWIFFRVTSDKCVDDVEKLLLIRAKKD